MKYFVILFGFLILVGFTGITFATHDPNQPQTHSIILPPDMKEKTFDEFMEWCEPYYEELCTKLEKNRVPIILSPLKQIKSGIPIDEIQCNESLIMVTKNNGSPACVTEKTKQKLIEREWVKNNRWTASYFPPDLTFEYLQNSIFNSDMILDLSDITLVKKGHDLIPILITGESASQICTELKMNCPVGHFFNARYEPNSQVAIFQQSVGLHIYDLKITNSRICHTVNGDTQHYCTNLQIPYSPIFDGNKPTLLSKTAEQWKSMSNEKLYSFYEKYGDAFYTELGKIILKNEIQNELLRQEIVNDDFTLYVMGIDQSLPPDVYLQTVVNGTDGKRYQFDGGTNTNKILNFSFEELKDLMDDLEN